MHLMEDIHLINDAMYQEGCVCLTLLEFQYGMVDKCHDYCRQQHKGRMLQLEKCSPSLRRQTARQTIAISLMEKLMEKLQM